MKIGELAKQTGLSIHALRYYEKRGLLVPQARSDANYRVYATTDIALVQFIQRCKVCGFSLDEIEALVAIQQRKSDFVCEDAKQLAREKVTAIQAQIAHLTETLAELQKLEAECAGGKDSAEHCPIIKSLEGEWKAAKAK